MAELKNYITKDGFIYLDVTDKAKEIFNNGIFELYGFDKNQEVESLIENEKQLNDFDCFVIEVGNNDFITDAKQIADYILLDVCAGNISEEETPEIAVDTYEEFGKNYGSTYDYDNQRDIPDGCIQFKDWICELQFGKYQQNNKTAIILIEHGTGEPIATATVNIPEILLGKNEVIIKDYSENEGMFLALFNAGIVKLNRLIPWHNNIDLHVCELLVEPKFD